MHTTHILIAGSREATPEILQFARRAVQRAQQKGYTILVGDNPQGVDRAVVRECNRLRVPVIVAGVAPFPRNGGCRHGQYVRVTSELYRASQGRTLNRYTVRDRWMVDQAQICLFIWNGKSPGTKAGHVYAVQRGKEAHLINFSREVQL